MTSVTNKDRMPKGPHWAIVTYSSEYHSGDERSRTNPGHGYPAHTTQVVNYQAFEDEDEWKENIRQLSAYGESFTAMKVIPAKITTNIDVTTDDI